VVVPYLTVEGVEVVTEDLVVALVGDRGGFQ